MNTNRAECLHLTSATVNGERVCAECGCDWYTEANVDKRERADRKAAAKVAKVATLKDTTPGSIEVRMADNERRRARYARTGR
jgi:hypothetical protein